MHEETGFLAAIRLTPADDIVRLVFADWLDEQDDSTCKTKAAFIRLELQMAEAPEQSLNRIRWTNKLQKLASQIDPAWLAAVSHPKLEACRMAFRFQCPKQWEQLTPTDVGRVRNCESCQQHVHFCTSLQEARSHAARGNCVALSLALVRKPDDLIQPGTAALQQLAQLAPGEMEVLGTSISLGATVGMPLYDLLPSPAAPEWTPQANEGRPSRRQKRKKRRSHNRNIQRQNWEEAE
jgi:uncharacterized protein (TIGR02996 family)